MIECIFTIDYEIYGNGQGSLRELVYEPTEKLKEIFFNQNSHFVVFVELAELEMLEAQGTDSAIDLVKNQIREFHTEGIELGLHLHPQWYNARYEQGRWILDYGEYNLCALPEERIVQVIDRSIAFLREVLGIADFTPFSFRAGNWLFQPTQTVANVLAERGIKVDSSVFKGGLQHQHSLDYRRALKNGYYWRFNEHVDVPDPKGILIELPIYTQMVPFWKMLKTKRISIEQRASVTARNCKNNKFKKLNRPLDFIRLRYPLKFDFCRMTLNELIGMVNTVVQEDRKDPVSFKPMVAIGHTKDLVDFETVDFFLSYLKQKKIAISTFEEIYRKCQ